MDLCNLLWVGFCDLLLHHANLKAETTETLSNGLPTFRPYLLIQSYSHGARKSPVYAHIG